jgi:ABC-2 type transport system ATP-binding protein
MSTKFSALKADTPAIETDALTRQFEAAVVVDRVSLRVEQGEIFGLIGPNGAGKTTLIRMLTTLLPPTSGYARVAGFDVIREAASVRRHIGYVPQLLSADGALTGYENMMLSARLYGIPRRERCERIDYALAMMGLAEAAQHLVSRYSGGMIRRLEIAQSLLHRPAVLFMDEPTVGLDPGAREAVWEHVLALREAYRMTMMVTTHYMVEVEELCDRLALISHGRIVAIGTPAEIKARAGPGATLDDVFIRLITSESETEGSYRNVRRARRAAREHG